MSFLRKELKQLLIEAQYMGIDKRIFKVNRRNL